MSFGYIYCFSNEFMPGIYKIGMTERTPEERLKEANKSTFVVSKFNIEFYKYVSDVKTKEKIIHRILERRGERIENKEFFNTNLQDIKDLFDLMEGHMKIINNKNSTTISKENDIMKNKNLLVNKIEEPSNVKKTKTLVNKIENIDNTFKTYNTFECVAVNFKKLKDTKGVSNTSNKTYKVEKTFNKKKFIFGNYNSEIAAGLAFDTFNYLLDTVPRGGYNYPKFIKKIDYYIDIDDINDDVFNQKIKEANELNI